MKTSSMTRSTFLRPGSLCAAGGEEGVVCGNGTTFSGGDAGGATNALHRSQNLLSVFSILAPQLSQ